MPRRKKLFKLRIRLLSDKKPIKLLGSSKSKKYVRTGYKRKVLETKGVYCAYCGKIIPAKRKAMVVHRGILYGNQNMYYHPTCYRKYFKVKKRK